MRINTETTFNNQNIKDIMTSGPDNPHRDSSYMEHNLSDYLVMKEPKPKGKGKSIDRLLIKNFDKALIEMNVYDIEALLHSQLNLRRK